MPCPEKSFIVKGLKFCTSSVQLVQGTSERGSLLTFVVRINLSTPHFSTTMCLE